MVGLKFKLLPLAYKDPYDLASANLSDLLLSQSCLFPSREPSLCTHPFLLLECSSPTVPHSFFALLWVIKSYLFSKTFPEHSGTLWHITLLLLHVLLFFLHNINYLILNFNLINVFIYSWLCWVFAAVRASL